MIHDLLEIVSQCFTHHLGTCFKVILTIHHTCIFKSIFFLQFSFQFILIRRSVLNMYCNNSLINAEFQNTRNRGSRHIHSLRDFLLRHILPIIHFCNLNFHIQSVLSHFALSSLIRFTLLYSKNSRLFYNCDSQNKPAILESFLTILPLFSCFCKYSWFYLSGLINIFIAV